MHFKSALVLINSICHFSIKALFIPALTWISRGRRPCRAPRDQVAQWTLTKGENTNRRRFNRPRPSRLTPWNTSPESAVYFYFRFLLRSLFISLPLPGCEFSSTHIFRRGASQGKEEEGRGRHAVRAHCPGARGKKIEGKFPRGLWKHTRCSVWPPSRHPDLPLPTKCRPLLCSCATRVRGWWRRRIVSQSAWPTSPYGRTVVVCQQRRTQIHMFMWLLTGFISGHQDTSTRPRKNTYDEISVFTKGDWSELLATIYYKEWIKLTYKKMWSLK